MEYIYGDFIGLETTSIEYKLFTFYPKGINIDSNDTKNVEELMYSGEWVFNNSVIENLEFYLDYYLPKYTTAYLSQYSEVDEGELIIGISDDGVIHGIPFKGDLDEDSKKEFINDKIKSVVESNLSYDSNKINIFDFIKWEVIKVNTSEVYHNNDLIKKIKQYEDQIEEYRRNLKKFKSKKKVWYDLIMRYNDRLHNMMNDKEKREEIINYIITKDPRLKNKNKRLADNKIIKKLKSNFIFGPISNEEINWHKDNIDSIWHWVTKWKDNMIDFLKEIKPTPPHGISSNLYPSSILTTAVDMIPKWIHKEKINLYLLKFKFIKPTEDIDIKYLSESLYKSCYRCNIDDIPCLHPSLF